MTTNELFNHLQKLPSDLLVVVRGYEDGYNAISELEMKTLKPHPGQDKDY